MGTFTFKWPHAAEEVYVTGTFDNWSKSEKMSKVGDHFEKTVTLPDASEKIFYKFVVDGNWTTDHTGPQEKDHEGNDNNILLPEQIIKDPTPAQVIMSSAAPESTTAELAKDVPLENTKPEGLPGTFPETPANELDKTIGINPLPAADGAVNPIKLAPGEPIPPSLAGNNINSHVKLDAESYEKSDTLPGVDTTLPPVSGNMIPESSLPIASGADVTINSAAPNSTTAALAAEVPLEPKVPEVVKESQDKAGVDPEASGISSEVVEKEKVEEELLKKVPEVPSTSEGTSGKGTEKSEGDKTLLETATATAAGLSAAAVATAVAAKNTVVEQAGVASTAATDAAAKLPEPVKAQLPTSVQETIAPAAKEQKLEEVSPEVPTEVKESIAEAGKEPEAAANTAAVEDKKEVEAQLLREVKPVEAVGESSAEPNGTEAAAAPKEPETPVKATEPAPTASSSKPADSPATTEKKKKNRISAFFGKLKSKSGDKK